MNLRKWVDSQVTACGCKSFYCTTCGGVAYVIQNQIKNWEDLTDKLIDLRSLNFEPTDFLGPRWYGFPRGQQCSDYVLSLELLMGQMNFENEKTVIESWATQAKHLDDFIVDGIGYYLIPTKHRNIWLPVLTARAEKNHSISETIKIKYSTLTTS